MKKTILIALAAICFVLTGCQDEIFNAIREEIKLKDSHIKGDIRSIVRFKDYLVLDNGDVYYKPASASYYNAWTEDTRAPSGHVVKVAADSNNLYCLTYSFKEDYNEGENVISSKTLYQKSDISGSWGKIGDYGKNAVTHLFCTNAPKDANRKAFLYVRESGSPSGTVYELSGTSKTDISSGSSYVFVEPGTKPLSCVYFDSKIYFFDDLGSATNETNSADATIMYRAKGEDIEYLQNGGTSFIHYDVNTDDDILAIAFTSDYLLFATDDGFAECPIDSSGIPTRGSDTDFANAASTLSVSYTVNTILAENPGAARNSNAVYAAITFSGTTSSSSAVFDNIGLWAYYPSRGKWNRE